MGENTDVTVTTKAKTKTLLSLLTEPIQWLQMLSSKLNPTFVIGVFLIYGVGQGLSGSLFKVVADYYWKDVQKLQPSTVQLFVGVYFIPWVLKPLWGILTDAFPIRGYRRRPYFIISGVIGTISAATVAFTGNLAATAALCASSACRRRSRSRMSQLMRVLRGTASRSGSWRRTCRASAGSAPAPAPSSDTSRAGSSCTASDHRYEHRTSRFHELCEQFPRFQRCHGFSFELNRLTITYKLYLYLTK